MVASRFLCVVSNTPWCQRVWSCGSDRCSAVNRRVAIACWSIGLYTAMVRSLWEGSVIEVAVSKPPWCRHVLGSRSLNRHGAITFWGLGQTSVAFTTPTLPTRFGVPPSQLPLSPHTLGSRSSHSPTVSTHRAIKSWVSDRLCIHKTNSHDLLL